MFHAPKYGRFRSPDNAIRAENRQPRGRALDRGRSDYLRRQRPLPPRRQPAGGVGGKRRAHRLHADVRSRIAPVRIARAAADRAHGNGIKQAGSEPIERQIARIRAPIHHIGRARGRLDAALVALRVLHGRDFAEELRGKAVGEHEAGGFGQLHRCAVRARGFEARAEECCEVVGTVLLHIMRELAQQGGQRGAGGVLRSRGRRAAGRRGGQRVRVGAGSGRERAQRGRG